MKMSNETFMGTFLAGNTNQNSSRQLVSDQGDRSLAYAAVLFVLFAIDVMGNSLVCVVTFKKLHQRTNTSCLQVFILSLAIADILRGTCQILPKALRYTSDHVVYGTVLCKTDAMTRSLFSYTSVITMVFIAIIRYRTIDKIHVPCTNIGIMVALAIWLFNIAVSTPYAVWFEVVDDACVVRKETLHIVTVYTMVTRMTNFFIPLVICSVCYIGVVKKTLRSSQLVSNIVGTNTIRRVKVNRNVTITCMLVVCAFAVTWTPFQIVMILVYSSSPPVARQLRPMIKYFWLPTAVNSCINPFIYGCLWKNFRSGTKEILGICRRSRVVPAHPAVRKETAVVRDKIGEFSLTTVNCPDQCLAVSVPSTSSTTVEETRFQL